MPTTYTTDGSQADVNSKVAGAIAGDTVEIPAGTFTWGTSGLGTVLDKAIILKGAGQGTTTINASNDADGLIFNTGAATVRGFTINQNNRRLFVCGGADGWRFCDLAVGGNSGRLWDIDACYGLIDHNVIYMPSEQIFMYGKPGVWDNDTQMGTANAVYIENNIFSSDGYTDANAYGQMVMRFNLVHGQMKFDSHGVWSNTPARSARFIEVYHNHWDLVGEGGFWPVVEFRGGTGRIFNNVADDNTFIGRGVLKPYEYGAVLLGGNFARYQGPDDYPILDQVGVGKDQLPDPVYMWGNRRWGGVIPIFTDWGAIPSDAIDEYRIRISNPSATYTMDDIIVLDRDYFTEKLSPAFDGTTGVGLGTAAEMAAITPATPGVGFWVTDEGDWRAGHEGASGRLYVWDGAAWVLNYEPFTYPHPLMIDTDFVEPEAPAFTSEVLITGTDQETYTLTATLGVVSGVPTPTITYQWKRDGVDIDGATGSTYLLVSDDVGTVISVLKTATNTAGEATSSDSTGEISPFLGDILIPNRTANSQPVTELWLKAAVGSSPTEAVIHHSGDYPTPPENGFVYAKHGTAQKHVFVFSGTLTLSQAIASRP